MIVRREPEASEGNNMPSVEAAFKAVEPYVAARLAELAADVRAARPEIVGRAASFAGGRCPLNCYESFNLPGRPEVENIVAQVMCWWSADDETWRAMRMSAEKSPAARLGKGRRCGWLQRTLKG